MPVLCRCPLCRAPMPETTGEARCPRCGEMVVPGLRKLCGGCGRDVTHDRRARDDAGDYLCPDCWARRLASRGETPAYVCQTCNNAYPAEQMYQAGRELICHACYAERTVDPDALLAEAAQIDGSVMPGTFTAPAPDSPFDRAMPEEPSLDRLPPDEMTIGQSPNGSAFEGEISPQDLVRGLDAYAQTSAASTYRATPPPPAGTPWALITVGLLVLAATVGVVIYLSVR